MDVMSPKYLELEWEWVHWDIVEEEKLGPFLAILNWRDLKKDLRLKGNIFSSIYTFLFNIINFIRYLSTPERVELATALGLSETQGKFLK